MRNADKVEVFCGFCNELYETRYETVKNANRDGRPTFCKHSCYWKWINENTSDQHYIDKFWSLVDKSPNQGPTGECWLWIGPIWKGYPSMCYRGIKKVATHFVHLIEYGRLPDTSKGEMMLHDCDFPMCVRHVRCGTHQQNMADMISKGRHAKGSQKKFAILDEDKVLLIRTLYSKKWTQESIAKLFGVSKETIAHVVKGKSWKHVPVINKDPNLPQSIPLEVWDSEGNHRIAKATPIYFKQLK